MGCNYLIGGLHMITPGVFYERLIVVNRAEFLGLFW